MNEQPDQRTPHSLNLYRFRQTMGGKAQSMRPKVGSPQGAANVVIEPNQSLPRADVAAARPSRNVDERAVRREKARHFQWRRLQRSLDEDSFEEARLRFDRKTIRMTHARILDTKISETPPGLDRKRGETLQRYHLPREMGQDRGSVT